jgi:hypothetical protein
MVGALNISYLDTLIDKQKRANIAAFSILFGIFVIMVGTVLSWFFPFI